MTRTQIVAEACIAVNAILIAVNLWLQAKLWRLLRRKSTGVVPICETKKDCPLSDQDKYDLARLKGKREAKDVEVEALKRAPGLFTEMEAEHAKQVAGFVFDCSRFGQFLTLNVRRAGNPRDASYYGATSNCELSTAINLQLVTNIKFVAGHGPDKSGTLQYRKVNTYNNETQKHSEVVQAKYPYVPTSRMLARSYVPKNKGDDGAQMGYYYNEQPVNHTTSNYPRPAIDDEIIFDGAYFTLYAPAGLGEKVYKQILRARRSG